MGRSNDLPIFLCANFCWIGVKKAIGSGGTIKLIVVTPENAITNCGVGYRRVNSTGGIVCDCVVADNVRAQGDKKKGAALPTELHSQN